MRPTILLMAILIFSACSNNDRSSEALQEGISDGRATRDRIKSREKPKSEKKLRYLYYANGGLRGYFNDGSIAGCPRCDLLKNNIQALYSEQATDSYTLLSNGHLKLKDGTEEVPDTAKNTAAEGWALINYQWVVKPGT